MVLYMFLPTIRPDSSKELISRISAAKIWLTKHKVVASGNCIMFNNEEDYLFFKLQFGELLQDIYNDN